MKRFIALAVALPLAGCIIGTVAETAVDVVTLPVKVATAGVDAATTSQSEANAKRGRQLRKEEERRGRALRKLADRCRAGKQLPTDDCSALARPN